MDETRIEGLLCPICMNDLGTITKLQEHFESAHGNEDGDVLQQLKEFFGKAKKKILKADVAEDSDEHLVSGGGGPATRSAIVIEEEFQEIGVCTSHMEYLREQRHIRINNYALETNRLLNRLYRLITNLPSEPDRRKEHERTVIPWVDDRDVKLCPNCATSFNLSKRRHHCRLCGGIMCQNCSHFIQINDAKKLTHNLFPGSTSIQSPSPVKTPNSGGLGSLRSMVEVMVSSNMSSSAASSSIPSSEFMRLCPCCKLVIDKQDLQRQLRDNKPIIVQLYERMKIPVEEIEKLIPQYTESVQSLLSGDDSSPSLRDVQDMRLRLTKLAETVDAISRKIGVLGSENCESPPAPVVLQLQGCIRMTTVTFLRESLLGLPSLPEEDKLKEIQERQRLQRESQREIQRKTAELNSRKPPPLSSSSSSSITSFGVPSRPTNLGKSGIRATGWTPQAKPTGDSSEPLVQQMDIIRNYIRQALEDQKMDEVSMLQNNLRELEEEYARKQRSSSPAQEALDSSTQF